jgi:hypothetical protein
MGQADSKRTAQQWPERIDITRERNLDDGRNRHFTKERETKNAEDRPRAQNAFPSFPAKQRRHARKHE